MSDNFIETQYDITKKSRLLKFYESNNDANSAYEAAIYIYLNR